MTSDSQTQNSKTQNSQTQDSKGRDSKMLDSGKQVPPGDIILSARAVSLARDGVELLHGISADIRRGSVTMLLGHNGAGKTLLLNCLHGLIRHDGGEISGPPASRQKMVFQKPVIMRRTARRHFQFVCPEARGGEMMEWFRMAGIEDRIDAPARAMSGGEQQKLALVGALASRPEILFLDEPTAHLDFSATKFVESMIVKANARGTTIVMTSHNRSQAQRLGHDVLLLDGGRLVEAAPAKTFFTAPRHRIARQYLDHL